MAVVWTFRVSRSVGRASGANGGGEFAKNAERVVPTEAGVGDALSVDERLVGNQLLSTCDEIALDHDSHDATISARDLGGDILRDLDLTLEIFVAVGMAAIDHHARRQ